MKIKVAVILAGMPRTYDQCYPSLFKMLKDVQADIFIHAWDVQGNLQVSHTKDGLINKDFIRTVRVNESSLKKAYSPKKIIVESFDGFETAHAGLAHIYEQWSDRLFIPVLSQWYKVQKAFELIDDLCAYDLILRCRFDALYNSIINWKKLLKVVEQAVVAPQKECYVHPVLGEMLNDTFAVGRPKDMKVYCWLYTALCTRQYESLIPNGLKFLGSEAILSLHLEQQGIKWLKTPLDYTLIRDASTLNNKAKMEADEYFKPTQHLFPYPSSQPADIDVTRLPFAKRFKDNNLWRLVKRGIR